MKETEKKIFTIGFVWGGVVCSLALAFVVLVLFNNGYTIGESAENYTITIRQLSYDCLEDSLIITSDRGLPLVYRGEDAELCYFDLDNGDKITVQIQGKDRNGRYVIRSFVVEGE